MIHLAFVFFLVGTYLDYGTSRAALDRGGVREQNPLTRWFFARLGETRGLQVKTVLFDGSFGLLFYLLPLLVPFFQGPEGRGFSTFFLAAAALAQIKVARGNAKLAGYPGLVDFVKGQRS